MTLDKLPVGHRACIKSVGGAGALHDRLLEMGLIPGTVVQVSKLAPLGDPMEIYIQGYSLTVRKAEAAMISVREEEEHAPGPGR